MVDLLHRFRSEQKVQPETKEIQPQHILVAGAGLEILRDIRDKLERLEYRIAELERRLEERMPEKVLTENKFKEEVQDSEDIVKRIVSEVEAMTKRKSIQQIIEDRITEVEKPNIVELKRIDKITSLLEEHGKLSSSQLSQLIGLSRTRCNEYFKKMENLGMAEPVLIGKEKFYKLKS